MQTTTKEATVPTCPACRSTELRHELADRHQCQNCGYRVIIGDDGRVKDFMPWTTAGRKRSHSR